MSVTPFNLDFASAAFRRLIFLALVLGVGSLAAAGPITDVQVVNVTPSGFGVVWRSTNATPSIKVFADPNGITNLAGQVGVEAYPLRTGNPDLAAGYERRTNAVGLRQQIASRGLMFMRVTDCHPGMTYYFRLQATPAAGPPDIYPATGPLPKVVTPVANSFVTNAQMLILNVPLANSRGGVVVLSQTNAAYSLAAVVGDGVGPDQAFFNVNDLFNLAGTANFTPLGDLNFNLQVMGESAADQFQSFTLTFSAGFSTALTSLISLNTDFLALQVGQAVLRAGAVGQVPILGSVNTNLTAIDVTLKIPPGHLTNLVLQSFAPSLDPAASTLIPQGNATWQLHLAARSGQTFIGSNLLARLSFATITNQASTFVPLQVTSATGITSGAQPVDHTYAQSGRVVVIANRPLLEAGFAASGGRQLTLYGKAWMSYQIERSTNLTPPIVWRPVRHFAQTNMVTSLTGISSVAPKAFFRAMEYMPDPPTLDAVLDGHHQRVLLGYGQPGTNYTVLARRTLSNVVPWAPVATYTLTNSFIFLPVPSINNVIFYRLQKN